MDVPNSSGKPVNDSIVNGTARQNDSRRHTHLLPLQISHHAHRRVAQKAIVLKRKVPRQLYFPILMLVALVVCSIWVLPLTFKVLSNAEQEIDIQNCFMMYSQLPDSQWYNPADAYSTVTDVPNRSLAIDANVGCPVNISRSIINVDGSPVLANFVKALPYVETSIISVINQTDNTADRFWEQFVPELQYLGSTATLKPRGDITAADGIIGLVMTWRPTSSYPRDVPLALKAYYNSTSGNMEYHSFLITWTISCNGYKATCASNTACGVLVINCDTVLVPVSQHSLSTYPYDRYWVGVEISIYADIVSMKDSSLKYRMAVPFHFTLTQGTPAFMVSQDYSQQDLASVGFEDDGATYFFPAQYYHGIARELNIKTMFQLKRSTIIITWSMFIVVLMWLMSIAQTMSALDYVFLRPRGIPPTLGLSAIGLVWALPAMRNNQPGAPPVGIVIDVAGFLWNMVLACISSVILLSGIYAEYHRGEDIRAHIPRTHDDEHEDQRQEYHEDGRQSSAVERLNNLERVNTVNTTDSRWDRWDRRDTRRFEFTEAIDV